MNPQNSNNSFFDQKTLLAIVIVFGCILGWQYYLTKKYPQTEAQVEQKVEKALDTIPTKDKDTVAVVPKSDIEVAPNNENIVVFKSEPFNFEISSRGMGLKNIQLNQFKERDLSGVIIAKGGTEAYLGETRIDGAPVYFNLSKVSETVYKGTGKAGEIVVTKTIEVNPAKYSVKTTIETSSAPKVLETLLVEEVVQNKSSSFLMPSFDFESVFVAYDTKTERADIKADESKIFDEDFKNVSIASVGKHYFTSAIIDNTAIAPTFSAKVDLQKSIALGTLKYVQENGTVNKFETTTFIGPKELKLLEQVDPRLTETINFGIFSIVAKPILMLLKLLYSWFGNYGVAIIIVTLFIRMLLLPLNVSSYKSMKKMQVIQPQLKALKERYKKDPRQLQVETMNLMKREKVNPIGGCLPMLLQLPVFIALYNVLAQSIELYQAPFMLWIHDLSLKDPYYVLPVLMGITMFIQQKITPTTMDPAQAKAMQIMPVIFSLMMISLPSGLTLYIFVSTLFGIIQQYMIMKEKKTDGEVGAVTKLN
ncbi:MAG: membrane protein insertase YidC [Bdellovibrionota bacterium]